LPSKFPRSATTLAAAMLVAAAPGAHAAHPLSTEDTGTQGTGNVEIENGFQRATGGGTSLFLYQPQVSVGLATTFDAILQPSFVALDRSGEQRVSGLGDTNADFKWRFLGVDPWSFAVRAGLALPTGQRDLSLLHGQVGEHALLVATWDATPTTVHANLGALHVPPAPGVRATTASVSAAVMQAVGQRMILTVDGTVGQSLVAAQHGWPGTVLGGAIWTIRPGLDIDAGWQTSFHSTPAIHTWLAGITWRFAP
jgi:hypothetical protein